MNNDEQIPGLEISPEILDLDVDEFRRLGYWVVDRTIEHLTTLSDRPAITTSPFTELTEQLGGHFRRSQETLRRAFRFLLMSHLKINSMATIRGTSHACPARHLTLRFLVIGWPVECKESPRPGVEGQALQRLRLLHSTGFEMRSG